jgi:uncharacterized membrane protein YbhN (UPF0104 family)
VNAPAIELAAPATALDPVDAVRPGTRTRADRRRPKGWVLGAGLLLLVAAVGVTAATVDADSGNDVRGLLASIGRNLLHLRWQFAAIVIALGFTHYLATAVAARAAAGLPLPLGETVLVQLAAAAANRLTPAGLGGAALNARYFTRRGLPGPSAVAAVSALALLGALADLIALTLLVLGTRALGLGIGAAQLSALLAHIRHLLGPMRSPWLWLGVALIVATAAAVWLARVRRRRTARFWEPVRALLVRPRALLTLMAASAATTLVLGFAFVASIAMVPGSQTTAPVAVVLVAFMLGSAAGSSVPVPAGLGSTEAALIAVLVGLGEPAAHAVQVVMIFRLITFWAPAAVGILATRALYRRSVF